MQQYDVVLIGTGQATGILVPALLERGKRIAIVEGDRVGGSCVNYGCTPTKTLVASARAAYMARRGPDFGIETGEPVTRYEKVAERINAMRMPATEGFQAWLEKVTDFYAGWASFIDERTIQVGEDRLKGETIIVHTGTRARTPTFPGIENVNWLDNKGILDLTELPRHLVVIGGSYIGLEFAQAFRRLGSEVTVLQRADRLITREDGDISAVALDVLSQEGIWVHLGVNVDRVEQSANGGVRVAISTRSGRAAADHRNNSRDIEGRREASSIVEGSHLLVGIGRVPNSDDLNLAAAGIEADSRGFITVDDYGRTSTPNIYAIGDVNGKSAFTHTSVHDGQVLLDHLSRLDGKSEGATKARKISDRTPIHSMFIDPPLARVGMSETEARGSGRRVLMAKKAMSKINRAREKAETEGVVKLLVDGDSKRILGATIFGVGGDEIIGMLALAMQSQLPYTSIQDVVLPHPTVSELIPWIFEELQPLS
ncbi:MAG: mercuric reductase [Spirochaetales bacterium]